MKKNVGRRSWGRRIRFSASSLCHERWHGELLYLPYWLPMTPSGRHCLLLGFLMPQRHAECTSGTDLHGQLYILGQKFADETGCLTQSQYTDARLTSLSADPTTPFLFCFSGHLWRFSQDGGFTLYAVWVGEQCQYTTLHRTHSSPLPSPAPPPCPQTALLA